MTDHQKAFEAAYLAAGHADWQIEKNRLDDYYVMETRFAWHGYQLAMESLPREAIGFSILRLHSKINELDDARHLDQEDIKKQKRICSRYIDQLRALLGEKG